MVFAQRHTPSAEQICVSPQRDFPLEVTLIISYRFCGTLLPGHVSGPGSEAELEVSTGKERKVSDK